MLSKSLASKLLAPEMVQRILHAFSSTAAYTVNKAYSLERSPPSSPSQSQILTPFSAIHPYTSQPLIIPGEFSKNYLQNQSRRSVHGTAFLMDDGSDGSNDQSRITYSIVPREKAAIVSNFLLNYYYKMEPISSALGMPLSEIDGWLHRFIRMSMFASVADVSVQAIDDARRVRVGVLASILVDPQHRKPPHLISFLDPTKHKTNLMMYEFFKHMEEGLEEANFREGGKQVKTIEHMFLNIAPKYAGQGISHKMLNMSDKIALTVLNCQMGYTVSTSEFSYKMFAKNGYEVVKEVKYADYTNSKGEKIFADKTDKLKPHLACRAMVKRFNHDF